MSKQLQLKKFFIITQKTFAFIGIDPLVQESGAIIKRPIICFGSYILSFVFALLSIDFCIKSTHEINEFTEVVSVLNQLIIALWKIAIFLAKRQRIHKLIRNIWQWNEKAGKVEFQIILTEGRKTALLSKLYFMMVSLAGAYGLFMPLIIKLFKYLQGLEEDWKIPHKASFFWDISTPVGYTAAYLWNGIFVHFLLNASVAIDTLFLWLMSNILVRFYILKIRLKRAGDQYRQISFDHIIKDIIKLHVHVLNLAQELDSVFSEIIFVKSLISCTQICFLIFCFMGTKTSVTSLLYTFIFLLAVSMQLILYCYNGHLIEEQSQLVSANVFEAFNWSEMPVTNQKILQMIMLRSQKCSHTTGIFFNLNLNLYLWFFKTAASLIAMLKTLEYGS